MNAEGFMEMSRVYIAKQTMTTCDTLHWCGGGELPTLSSGEEEKCQAKSVFTVIKSDVPFTLNAHFA